MERYGSDKPDTRYEMEIFNLADQVKDCGFAVFTNALNAGGGVHGICAKGAFKPLSRKELDKLTDFIKGIGGKGMAWMRLGEDGSVASSFKKFMTEDEMQAIIAKGRCGPGDVIMIISDERYSNSLTILGQLRINVAKKLDLIPKNVFKPLWIVEFPFFDWDEGDPDLGGHAPPLHRHRGRVPSLPGGRKPQGRGQAQCYDMVLNGIELASGSIRITDPALQNRVFQLLGLSDEEAHQKFGHPDRRLPVRRAPHGGMALGLDRVVMQLLGSESLRDVLAFPRSRTPRAHDQLPRLRGRCPAGRVVHRCHPPGDRKPNNRFKKQQRMAILCCFSTAVEKLFGKMGTLTSETTIKAPRVPAGPRRVPPAEVPPKRAGAQSDCDLKKCGHF